MHLHYSKDKQTDGKGSTSSRGGGGWSARGGLAVRGPSLCREPSVILGPAPGRDPSFEEVNHHKGTPQKLCPW